MTKTNLDEPRDRRAPSRRPEDGRDERREGRRPSQVASLAELAASREPKRKGERAASWRTRREPG